MSFDLNSPDHRSNILWEHTAPPGSTFEHLSDEKSTDVAVVGGGVAGLSTALHLARAGVSVTLLEATAPGGGASGRSGGLIAPDLIRNNPDEVELTLGRDRGARLVHMVGDSARFCFDLIDELGLDCEGNQSGFWTPSHNQSMDMELRDRAQQWHDRGFNVRYAGEEETTEKLGAVSYHGAVVFEDGGTVNPLALSRALAAAAQKSGASIYVNSPVQQLVQKGSEWRLSTEHGLLKARRLVLAANGGNAQLHPRLRNTALPLNVIEYATRPLTEAEQADILKSDISFTDKKPYLFTARFDINRRLIAAFPDFPIRLKPAILLKEAEKRIALHFPALAGIEIDYLWPGQAWINTDLLPRIYQLGNEGLAVQACNGRGLATNIAIGAEVAAALASQDYHKLSVRPMEPIPVRGYSVMQYLPTWLMLLAHLRARGTGLFT